MDFCDKSSSRRLLLLSGSSLRTCDGLVSEEMRLRKVISMKLMLVFPQAALIRACYPTRQYNQGYFSQLVTFFKLMK